MKLKFISQITIIILLSVCSAHSVFALTVIGRNPFHQPPLTSQTELINMLMERQGDVKEGLTKAGQGDIFETFMAQIAEAEITEVEYEKGQTFQWMFYRKDGKGKVRIDKSLVWEGETSISSYEFHVDYKGQRYVFTVPLVCGNLALLTISSIPVVPAPVVVPPAESAGSLAVGSPGSGAGPQKVIEESDRLPIIVDAAYLNQLDPSHHVLVRAGLEYSLNESFSLIGMVGVAPQYAGSEGDDAFVVDFLGNYSFSRFFVGFGLGAWLSAGDNDIKSEDSDLDLILNFGGRVFGEPDAFNTSLFVEVRSGVDELDEFDLYGRVAAGLRFRF